MLSRQSIGVIIVSTLLAVVVSCSTRRPQDAVATASPSPEAKSTVIAYPSPLFDYPYHGTGVVVLVNIKEGWIEINHEDIKGLMPAMQMEFWVKDRALLKTVQTGDKVDFTVIETHQGEYLTEIKKQTTSR
jgi:Cu/Ag efflux protein CusF